MLILSVFLLLYCALLDFSAPVVRASLLILIGAWRRIVRRASDPLTMLCSAFLAILLVRPLDLFSVSFQLSFCAVLGIVVFSPRFPDRSEASPARALLSGGRTALSATIGVALPTMQVFHRISLIGLLVNPPACGFFAVLLPMYLLVMLVGCAWLPGGMWLARFVNPVTRGLIAVITWLGRLPFASVRVPFLPWYCLLAVTIALALATRYIVLSPGKKLAAAFLTLLVSFGAWRLTVNRDVQYVQLAMGQADAAILMDGPESCVIDTGEYGGDVAAYLLSTGRQADRLILTHLHADHCLGVRQLLKEDIPIGTVYLPEGAEDQLIDEACASVLDELNASGIPIFHLAAGDGLRLSRASLTAVWPMPGAVRPAQDANRYSLCLLLDLDGVKLLTCADVPGDYEAYAARDADILKAAHHASKASTGADFLEAVSPQAALITASRRSGSLPHPDTVGRLREAGAMIFNTAEPGAVTITAKQGTASITTFLHEKEQK